METQVMFFLLVVIGLVNGGQFQFSHRKRELTIPRSDGSPGISGKLGTHLQDEGIDCGSDDDSSTICRRWEDAELQMMDDGDVCKNVSWTITSGSGAAITDCFALDGHWFGGSEQYRQYWPVEKQTFVDYSYVTKEQDFQGTAERYWLSSSGQYIYVEPDTPLFIDQNHEKPNHLCLTAKNAPPYSDEKSDTRLSYRVCTLQNARLAHEHALSTVLGKPSGIPDERMIRYPIWSTWAKYKRDINEEVVQEFADQILENGFENSQLEIDDLWETCYGSLTFDTKKFPDIKNLTDSLKAKVFRVTLWIHPFINVDCEPYHSEAEDNGYLVKDTSNNTQITWWNGNGSVIDFTNTDAVSWWVNRLKTLQEGAGIDSFKFDAGETSFLPQVSVLTGDINLQPGIFTQRYVETVSQFGSMIEIRVGERTQHLPNFIRMLDKDSRWTMENGLPTLITTLLQMNMVGYPIVLPDMVGGNGYGNESLTKELFIRWLQATVFMPAIQFSYVPWDFDDETIAVCRHFTELHANYSDKIIAALKQAVVDGSPVNPPIWWIYPEDAIAQAVDDEFLLGEDLLIAPVVVEGAVSRDIYLPAGTWRDELRPDQDLIKGRKWLRDYPASLHDLPFFTKVK